MKILLESKTVNKRQLDLFNKTFNVSFPLEKWINKHYSNIYADQSENVCMYKNDRLIGFNMFMPQKYSINNEEVLLLQSCETSVDSEERGKGYFGLILEESEKLLKDNYSVIYGIPNKNSKPTFDKLGYIEKNSFNAMMKLGSIHSIAKDLYHIVTKTKGTMNYKTIDSIFQKEDYIRYSKSIENIKLPSPSMAKDIHIIKDHDFYQWKIDSSNKYRYIYVEKDSELKVLCLVKFSFLGRLTNAEIVDIYLKDGCHKDLKKVIKCIAKHCSLIKIMTCANGKTERIMKSLNFFYRRKKECFLVYKTISADSKLNDEMSRLEWDFLMIEADTIMN